MRVVYHGAGYTGFTGAVFAARAGHEVVIFEPNEERVAAVNAWKEPVVGIADWLGSELFTDPTIAGRLVATSDFEVVASEMVHIFAVPTERDGEPMFDLLNAAIDRVASVRSLGRPLVLSVESTVHPDFAAATRARLATLMFEPYTLIIAPRRDWFVGKGHNVETCERIIGVDGADDRAIAERIYGPISRSIHWTDCETAEIVKQLENALLYANVTFLMGFALTYPEKNVRDIIRLACTHWRLPPLYLTLGVAGYCVPLGMKYLTRGMGFEYGQVAIETEAAYRSAVAQKIIAADVKTVAILGVSDKANQRIQHLSPALTLYQELTDAGLDVMVHDCQFTAQELGIPWQQWLKYPNELHAQAVIVHTPYPEYRMWLPEIQRAHLVIDGPGIFEVDRLLFERMNVAYFRVGDPGWLVPAPLEVAAFRGR
jgi:UDP-N-acetyl-D-mannosaminuronic acid dehydrogenase